MSVKIIAEIGQAHEGSLGMAHAYIDVLADTGVDVIKFQTHIAEAESSIYEPFRIQMSGQDKSRQDYWKRMEFTLEQWASLKIHCEEKKLEFLSTPFSNAAVDLLERVGVNAYKIGSGDVGNPLLIEKIARTGKPVILSNGLVDETELDQTIKFLKSNKIETSVLQCTSEYPTKPEQYNFNQIPYLKERYSLPVGFSDHSGKPETAIAALCFGAEILEFHTVFSRDQYGPDVSSSLTIKEIKNTVDAVRRIERSIQNKETRSPRFEEYKSIFGKSLSVNKDLNKGHILTFEDLEAKKPAGHGISAHEYKTIIGKKLAKTKTKWDFLNFDDFE